jgi:hypothetical protein
VTLDRRRGGRRDGDQASRVAGSLAPYLIRVMAGSVKNLSRQSASQLAALVDGMDWSRLQARDIARPRLVVLHFGRRIGFS